MRDRETIERDTGGLGYTDNPIIVEVLLDIRDLLSRLQKGDK